MMTHAESPSNAEPRSNAEVAIISDLATASVLLKNPRRRLLELAQTPITTVEMAERLNEPRQRLGYHVRCLVEAGLLLPEAVSRRGSMIERQYRASARAYALAPELLGTLAARLNSRSDRESVAHLLGAVHEVQTDIARALEEPGTGATELPTLTISSRLRFRHPDERAAFAEALVRALTEVTARHTSPFQDPQGNPAPGDPFRLTLTLNPTIP